MIISQMVAAKLLKGASPVSSSGARGFLFGGFLTFRGASPVAEVANVNWLFHRRGGRRRGR